MPQPTFTRLWKLLETAEEGDRIGRVFDVSLIALIVLNVAALVVGTVPDIERRFATELWWFEVFSVAVFSSEYVLRFIACTASSRYRHPITGRIRYTFSPLALIDLVAILPFYLPMLGLDLRVLRMFRLLRLARLLKLGRYSDSLRIIQLVVWKKRSDLAATLFVVLFLLVISSSIVYFAEADEQPEAFGSIPHCMWWGVATLTTVGYGDAYPITPTGKVIGAVVAILGIGLFALPTAILGAAFVEELETRRRGKETKEGCCPHCGRSLEKSDE